MHTHQSIAEHYLTIWNEPDPDRRRALVAAGWTANGSYADPLMLGHGHDGIAAMIQGARASFAGHACTLRGTPEGHGSFVRFVWPLVLDGSAPVAGSTDVARHETGRLTEVTGILDGTVSDA